MVIWDGYNPPVAEVVTRRGEFLSAVESRTASIEGIPAGIAGSLRDFLRAQEGGAADGRVPRQYQEPGDGFRRD
jgi:hypothetical protein